jgi:hypothetical protein
MASEGNYFEEYYQICSIRNVVFLKMYGVLEFNCVTLYHFFQPHSELALHG